MVTPVILAEKPKQALAYAESMKAFERKDGYFEIKPNEIFPEGAYLTWAIGHVLELAKPEYYDEKWSKWNLNNLPIKPDSYTFLVSDSKVERYEVINRLLEMSESVILATDPDREGENIGWSILSKTNSTDKDIKRLWINSLENDVIRDGFRNLRNGRDYYPSYIEAQTRQISDWLVGMNASQLFTLLLNSKGVQGTYSVGRVQTPTLFMIYQRENEMKNFKPTIFCELIANIKHENGEFIVKADGKFEKKELAITEIKNNSLIPSQSNQSKITGVHKTLEKEPSPRLFTMSAIQTKANRIWKYSPAKVLKIVQGLYEKKMLTYPRTDTHFITESEFQYLKQGFEGYKKIIDIDFPMIQTEPIKRYVDNSKVQEHYAIIPTKMIPTDKDIQGLSIEEKNIYLEVVRNTIAMFHEPYQFEQTVIEINHQNIAFKTKGKVEVNKGWKDIYPSDNELNNEKASKNTILPVVAEGDTVQLFPEVKEGKTTKPKRYTEGDLIPMMIHSGKQLDGEEQSVLKETEGIGTEATRANIIETLKKQEYIDIKKNLVHITSKGVILCDLVDGSLLASPAMTAKWETFLKRIGKGERKQEDFLKGIYQFIDKLLVETPERLNSSTLSQSISASKTENHIGKCPSCSNGYIVERKSFYGCTASDCKQTFGKELLKKTVTITQMKKLLTKNKTDVIKGFKGKKDFDACLVLEKDENKGTYKFKFNF